jgi:hypothetical protein
MLRRECDSVISAAAMSRGKPGVAVYNVPAHVIGRPHYNWNDMLLSLAEELKNDGYEVLMDCASHRIILKWTQDEYKSLNITDNLSERIRQLSEVMSGKKM